MDRSVYLQTPKGSIAISLNQNYISLLIGVLAIGLATHYWEPAAILV